jgi:hypothetical protein
MYLAKPFDRNLTGSKQFETLQECKKFLDEFTEQKMPLDEWMILGKIVEVLPDGNIREIEVDIESFL